MVQIESVIQAFNESIEQKSITPKDIYRKIICPRKLIKVKNISDLIYPMNRTHPVEIQLTTRFFLIGFDFSRVKLNDFFEPTMLWLIPEQHEHLVLWTNVFYTKTRSEITYSNLVYGVSCDQTNLKELLKLNKKLVYAKNRNRK